MPGPFVSLLTDFGTADPWVAICKGVILTMLPEARLIDISHDIPPFRIRAGAFVLAAAAPELPEGIHLAVVDPGVGTARRPIGLRAARGDLLVGPDNGLLVPAAEALGGVIAAHELANPDLRRIMPSRTFHGRDIFAPAAAHLAAGVPLDEFGPVVPPESLVMLRSRAAAIDAEHRAVMAEVLYVDGYGNVKLNLERFELEAGLGPLTPGNPVLVRRLGSEHRTRWGDTFGDAPIGGTVLYEDSLGRVALAVNQGDAAETLGLREAALVRISRAEP